MIYGNVKFNQYTLEGYKCVCGEIYYEPDQAERILLLNKLRKMLYRIKLNKVKSNLILRIPKDVSDALALKEGEEITLAVKNKEIVVQP